MDIVQSKSIGDMDFDFQRELLPDAIYGIVQLFRASQYVVKMNGGNSNASLPLLALIYYELWELVLVVTKIYIEKNQDITSLEQAVAAIREAAIGELWNYNDVSSRVLNLFHMRRQAVDQIDSVIEMMDSNSRDRINVLKEKYYLDGDFEDGAFTLDWISCQSFIPGAYIRKLVMEYEMNSLSELLLSRQEQPQPQETG